MNLTEEIQSNYNKGDKSSSESNNFMFLDELNQNMESLPKVDEQLKDSNDNSKVSEIKKILQSLQEFSNKIICEFFICRYNWIFRKFEGNFYKIYHSL